MSDHPISGPLRQQEIIKRQGELLQIRTAQNDALGRELLTMEKELERLGSMLILAVRAAGGRVEVSDEEQKALPAFTTVSIEEPSKERPTWVLTVIDVPPEDAPSGEDMGPGSSLEVHDGGQKG